MTPTLDGSRHSSRLWRQRRKCMEQNGPKLEQRWLLCGWKGLHLSFYRFFGLLVFIRFEQGLPPYSQCMSSLSSRGLRFIQVFLQSLVDGEKDDSNPNLIKVNVTKAYEIALKRYHGWLVQQLFKVSSESFTRDTFPRKQMYDHVCAICEEM